MSYELAFIDQFARGVSHPKTFLEQMLRGLKRHTHRDIMNAICEGYGGMTQQEFDSRETGIDFARIIGVLLLDMHKTNNLIPREQPTSTPIRSFEGCLTALMGHASGISTHKLPQVAIKAIIYVAGSFASNTRPIDVIGMDNVPNCGLYMCDICNYYVVDEYCARCNGFYRP